MPKKSVIVTGGAGYIGSATCHFLSEQGFHPVVIDDLSTGFEDNVRWGPLYKGCFSDESLLKEIVLKHEPVAVLHFAAKAYVSESMRIPITYLENNFSKSIALLGHMISLGVDKMVFSSSCATYGMPRGELINENDPLDPINPYGLSKKVMEETLTSLTSLGLVSHVSLRYFNAAGAIPDLGIGERHKPETHALPLAVKASLTGEEFSIYGDDYETPDGTAIRDFVHVSDLARAHVLALQHLLENKPSLALNLGTGEGTSIREILDTLAKLGHHVKSKAAPKRPGDPPRLVADASLALDRLCWSAEKSGIAEIIENELEWQRSGEL